MEDKKMNKDEKQNLPEERTSVTEHVIQVNEKCIEYVATTGMMHIRNDEEKTCAAIFYMAYTLKDTDPVNRPITFCFNGGWFLFCMVTSRCFWSQTNPYGRWRDPKTQPIQACGQ